jgi:hypothetical protein
MPLAAFDSIDEPPPCGSDTANDAVHILYSERKGAAEAVAEPALQLATDEHAAKRPNSGNNCVEPLLPLLSLAYCPKAA